jgi:hypothetical protein
MIIGRLIAESEREILVESPDQRQTKIARSDVRIQTVSDAGIVRLDPKALVGLLKREYPSASVIASQHYLLCHDMDDPFAEQASRLLEQVFRSYFAFCKELGLPAKEPTSPLIVIAFRDRGDFNNYCVSEFGASSTPGIAFYSLTSNRVVICVESATTRTVGLIVATQRLELDSRSLFATHLVHEATHQLMCNSGLQQRFAPYPLWVSEGLAAYFETADPYARSGWRRPGGLQSIRIEPLRSILREPNQIDLEEKLFHDGVFRQTNTAGDAYSLAWGATYFLIKRHRQEYAEYLCDLSTKQPLQNEPKNATDDRASQPTWKSPDFARRIADYFKGL